MQRWRHQKDTHPKNGLNNFIESPPVAVKFNAPDGPLVQWQECAFEAGVGGAWCGKVWHGGARWGMVGHGVESGFPNFCQVLLSSARTRRLCRTASQARGQWVVTKTPVLGVRSVILDAPTLQHKKRELHQNMVRQDGAWCGKVGHGVARWGQGGAWCGKWFSKVLPSSALVHRTSGTFGAELCRTAYKLAAKVATVLGFILSGLR